MDHDLTRDGDSVSTTVISDAEDASDRSTVDSGSREDDNDEDTSCTGSEYGNGVEGRGKWVPFR